MFHLQEKKKKIEQNIRPRIIFRLIITFAIQFFILSENIFFFSTLCVCFTLINVIIIPVIFSLLFMHAHACPLLLLVSPKIHFLPSSLHIEQRERTTNQWGWLASHNQSTTCWLVLQHGKTRRVSEVAGQATKVIQRYTRTHQSRCVNDGVSSSLAVRGSESPKTICTYMKLSF